MSLAPYLFIFEAGSPGVLEACLELTLTHFPLSPEGVVGVCTAVRDSKLVAIFEEALIPFHSAAKEQDDNKEP